MAKASAATEEKVVLIPLDSLKESPFQYRKTKADLTSMVAAVKSKGSIDTPIRVRPLDKVKGKDKYEIIYGHCRVAATKEAGKDVVPGIVCRWNDVEVREAQFRENAQRQDVHPLEEAEGYETYMQSAKLEVDQLAARVQRRVIHVVQRLQLLKLEKHARKAYYDGKIPSLDHAFLIARLPKEQQVGAIDVLESRRYTANELRDWIKTHVYLSLANAPFSLSDQLLVKKAGSCETCPKRTVNQATLFGDVKKDDLCTDGVCYAAKVDAEWLNRVANAEKTGLKVLSSEDGEKVWSGDQVMYTAPYVDLEAHDFSLPGGGQKTIRDFLKEQLDEKQVILARSPQGRICELLSKVEYKRLLNVLFPAKGKDGAAGAFENSQKAAQKLEKASRAVRGEIYAMEGLHFVEQADALTDRQIATALIVQHVQDTRCYNLLAQHGMMQAVVEVATKNAKPVGDEKQDDAVASAVYSAVSEVLNGEDGDAVLEEWLNLLPESDLRKLQLGMLLESSMQGVHSAFPAGFQYLARQLKVDIQTAYTEGVKKKLEPKLPKPKKEKAPKVTVKDGEAAINEKPAKKKKGEKKAKNAKK